MTNFTLRNSDPEVVPPPLQWHKRKRTPVARAQHPRKWTAHPFSIACLLVLLSPTHAFLPSLQYNTRPPLALLVAVDPIQSSPSPSPSSSRHSFRLKPNKFSRKHKPKKRDTQDPVVIETAVHIALDALRVSASLSASSSTKSQQALLFPTVRECNAALSAFGDQGDLLRALRLFGKMRKAVYFQQCLKRDTGMEWPVPVPTLVTYSTLMSRAVRAHKPHVALRLWKMRPSSSLQPDVKAINILMNCYAKLGNVVRAKKVLTDMKLDKIEPNLVTFNTVLNACQQAGDLDAALEIKSQMEEVSVHPDTRTYTTLLATVARGPSKVAGARDPTIATQLLQEMYHTDVEPNGMTYSAFIEACGRCGRPDLALQGLRVMQRQKDQQQQKQQHNQRHTTQQPSHSSPPTQPLLDKEVGAWTSAIHVCGKAGRWETAIRLFRSMKKLGCAPNAITCGCLMDSLLRAGRTAETLSVLRYMKREGIQPTEVMYTLLMTRADRLVQMETNQFLPATTANEETAVTEESGASAMEVYTELMLSLMDAGSDTSKATGHKSRKQNASSTPDDANTLLLKVFLVFQQMKAAGAEPDLACFNVLLRACARAGDVARGWDVLRQIEASPKGLEPNDRSWRELLQAAATAREADTAETVWKYGVSYHLQHQPRMVDEPERRWNPSIKSLQSLLIAYAREAVVRQDKNRQRYLYEQIIQTYDDVLMGDRRMGLQRIEPMEMLDDRRTILAILHALVALHPLVDAARVAELRSIGRTLLKLDCLREDPPLSVSAQALIQSLKAWN